MKVQIWHNIMWSRYKAVVLSEVAALCKERNIDVAIHQIAETDSNRTSLSPTDHSLHKYPYLLEFPGAYGAIPKAKLFARLARHAWTTNADVVALAGYEKPEYWIQLLILKLRGKKVAFFCDSTIYDNIQTYWKGLAKRFFFKTADLAFGYGARARDYLIAYGMPPENIRHRCQAAALQTDYNADIVLAEVKALSKDPNDLRLLYVGRLAPEKRIETLIQTTKRLADAGHKATAIIVGTGPMEASLRKLAQDLGISDKIVFAGAKSGDGLWAEYKQATCMVLPSYSEPWGLVANEALAYGCPIIVSHRCGCVPELVIDGKTGFAFQCEDVADLTDKVLRVRELLLANSDVAEICIRHITTYNPRSAARDIIDGLENIESH